MVAQGEFESLFKGSIDKINITPGSIVNAKVIEIRNDYVIINAGLKSKSGEPKELELYTSSTSFISLQTVHTDFILPILI